jgi:diguanylate cyclase (GGDEF)-like protein/PAS domain S-box-containing protein
MFYGGPATFGLLSFLRKVAALLGAHLAVVLASAVGVCGLAVSLFLPTGGTALAWFIPLLEGATVLSAVVVAAMAGIDVIVRQERSALPYVGIGTAIATLWLVHLLSFTGLLLPTLVGARDGGLFFHFARIAMPALLPWALLQAPGSLPNPRRAVTMVVVVTLMAAGAAVGVTRALDPILQSVSLARHFTEVNTAFLGVEAIAVAAAVCLFVLGRRGDPRFAGALTGALILLGFEAIAQALSQAPYDAAWYAAAALRLDPALLLMAGMLSLYGSSVRAERVAEARHRMLEELETNLKLTVEMSPVAVISTDQVGTITGWNSRAEAMFGWPPAEAIGRHLWTMVAAAGWQRMLRRRVRRVGSAGAHQPPSAMELTAMHRDGHAIPIELMLTSPQGPAEQVSLVALVRELVPPDVGVLPTSLRVAVTEPFATEPTWAEAAPRMLQGICDELGWDVGEFWLVDRDADVLRWEHGWHRPSPELERFTALRRDIKVARGRVLLGAVWKTGRPYWSADMRRDSKVSPSEVVAGAKLRSGGAFAIPQGSDIVGVLAFFSRRRIRLDRFRLERLDELARDLGSLIQQKRSEEAMRASGQRIRAVLDHVVDGLITFDDSGRIESFNPAAQRLFGYEDIEAVGQDLKLLITESHQSEFLAQIRSSIRPGKKHATSAAYETQGRRKDGSGFPLEFTMNQVRLGNDRLYIGLLRDITERKAMTEALEYRALHDSLTGLPNRTFLVDRLEQTLLIAHRERQPRAFLVLDLNGFKEINDTLGHHQGDRALQEVARRLRRVLRKADTVGRLGGDEFAVLPGGATDASRAILIAEKLLQALEPPFQLGEHTVEVGASIGIAIYPEHGEDATTLARHADIAMYVAKRAHTGYNVYTAEQGSYPPARPPLIAALGAAIDQLELLLHYQPIVDLRTGIPDSVEALVRWGHPRHGLLSPNDFVPAAEQTELIHPLTRWVLNEALRQAHEWQTAGVDLAVAVNLSGRNLLDPELAETITGLLQAWSISPEKLILEITERTTLTTEDFEALRRLHGLGVRLAVDDFGTGYSTLTYLRNLPLSEVKIDRSFVTDMVTNQDDATIVRSTIDLGHSMGLKVVAEGVDNAQTARALADLNCDLMQGFYVARPMVGSEISAWLEGLQHPLGQRQQGHEKQ